MKFSKVLPLGGTNPLRWYWLGTDWLGATSADGSLGVWVERELNMSYKVPFYH